jgi:hypothetical protein
MTVECKLAVLPDVREYTEGETVELWLNRYGRVVIRAYNECGNNYTDVDLDGLLDWVRSGPTEGANCGRARLAAISAAERD